MPAVATEAAPRGPITRRALAVGLCAALAGCTLPEAPDRAAADLGDFRLGHVVVVAREAQKLPFSRPADEAMLRDAITQAVRARFGGQEGSRFFHFGIFVDGYALAAPGVPVLAAPKSTLALSVTLWDDATQTILTASPEPIVVFENASGATVLGSGLVRGADEQLAGLAANAARAIEAWLLEHPEWTGADAGS